MISNGLEIGTRALEAHKYAMDVIGNNIANVNTPGYSRQRVNLETTAPTSIPVINKNKPMASLGTGVKVVQIQRLRDEFLDTQKRDLLQSTGEWDQKSQNLGIIESTFNEPSDSGISARLNSYWNAWQSVASPDPSSSGARSSLVSQGQLLANQLTTTRQNLSDLRDNNDKDIILKVQQINDLADQLAALNGQIIKANATGSPNDLLDKRNQLVGELSGLVNIEYYQDSNGAATLAIGGSFLVSGIDSAHLDTAQNADNRGYSDVVWKDSGKTAAVTNGTLFGLIQSRDVTAKGFMDNLDTMTQSLMSQVNAVHQAGFGLHGETGMSFFIGTNASDISVNAELVYDPSKIAASSTIENVSGNGEGASAIAHLRTTGILDSGSSSVEDFYQNLISRLGTDTSQANTKVETNKALMAQVDQQISSVSGVSIDEEMSEMIKFEHAYGAAAKYISTVQRTLDQLMAMLR
jgi:flagellar hook-associated protein 1 FlgK